MSEPTVDEALAFADQVDEYSPDRAEQACLVLAAEVRKLRAEATLEQECMDARRTCGDVWTRRPDA